MKLQRSTVILVVLALLLGGVVYSLERGRKSLQSTTTQAQSQKIFAFKEDDVQAFSIRTPDQILSFSKHQTPIPSASSEPFSSASPRSRSRHSSDWLMQTPVITPADEASVAYLLNLLATARSKDRLTIPVARRSNFGLDKPLATVEIKLANQETHRLVLGQQNFDRSALYAQIDPPDNSAQELEIVLVPPEFENAVQRPLMEWKAQDE